MAPTPKNTRPKKGTRKKPQPQRNYRRLISSLLLLSLLAISLLAAGYVIFFRTVVAGELQQGDGGEEQIYNREGSGETSKPPGRDLPKVAIIIDDLGYNEEIAMAFLDLPIELTYSFLPFAPYTKKLARLAHRRGKTVFLHLPLEPKDKSKDPGPGAIYLSDSPEVQREKLEKCLEAVPYAVGVNNHMGSAFTEDREAMENILSIVGGKRIVFVDSYTTGKTVGPEIASKLEIEGYRSKSFLDNKFAISGDCDLIEELVRMAEKDGYVVGIAHPYLATLDAMRLCLPLYTKKVQYTDLQRRL